MKHLVFTHRRWNEIFTRIKEEHAATPSVYLIREKMKNTLGFTVREHTHYNGDIEYVDTDDWRDYRSQICIDFYDEAARTMFMLKYL